MNIRVAMMIVGTMLLDQASKYLIEEKMRLGQSISVIPDVFHITYVLNSGAAFGLFPQQKYFFIASAILMVLFGVYGIQKWSYYGEYFIYGVGAMIAGALGNLIDRVRLSAVVDFFDFRIWPVFNIADIAIVCGAMAIVWSFWLEEKREKQNNG